MSVQSLDEGLVVSSSDEKKTNIKNGGHQKVKVSNFQMQGIEEKKEKSIHKNSLSSLQSSFYKDCS